MFNSADARTNLMWSSKNGHEVKLHFSWFHFRNHWGSDTPKWNEADYCYRTSQCSLWHLPGLLLGSNSAFHECIQSSAYERSSQQLSYPNSRLFGSCCMSSHIVWADPDIDGLHIDYHDPNDGEVLYQVDVENKPSPEPLSPGILSSVCW